MSTAGFKDHFSSHAGDYARYRPAYPAELFHLIAALAPRHGRCWDAGTGSGQAAVGLAPHFAEVVATDASAEQIAHAAPHPRVAYRVATAECSGLEDGWADAITVGQALHWFDLKNFFDEVRRVSAPGAVLAAWAYDLFSVDAAFDAVLQAFHDRVKAFWPPERALVARRYADLVFPFEEIPIEPVPMTAAWTLERALGYLSTWSAAKGYRKGTGRNPVAEFAPRLAAAWGDPGSEKIVTWPLALRAGRVV